jgi:hypothetical protein
MNTYQPTAINNLKSIISQRTYLTLQHANLVSKSYSHIFGEYWSSIPYNDGWKVVNTFAKAR